MIKRTKKLESLLIKWETTLRTTDTPVMHALTKAVTMLPPLEFALFETAIKAVDASWVHSGLEAEDIKYNSDWYTQLARFNGFSLCRKQTNAKQAARDYRYCVGLLQDAGFGKVID